MGTRFAVFGVLALLAAAALGWAAFTVAGAQDAEADKSAFIRFVEEQISSEEMQIRLGAINGALHSDVTVSRITVADSEGVWLTIEGVHLVWNRLALLAGTLDIDLLEAERIAWTRAGSGGADTGGGARQLPEPPADILIDALTVARVEIGAEVLGIEAVLAVDGNMSLQEGSLKTRLAIERIDRPGNLSLEAAFDNDTSELDLVFVLTEPEGGVIASALGLKDRPAVDFSIKGSGPIDAFNAEMLLAANGEPLFGGPAVIAAADDGYRLNADLAGGLETLVDSAFAPYFGADAALRIDATRYRDGTIAIGEFLVRSGLARLSARGELASDGVPVRLQLEAMLGDGGRAQVPLPGTGGARVSGARITASLGEETDGRWSARAELDGLVTPDFSAGRGEIAAGGIARNLGDPETRSVTFDFSGRASEIQSGDAGLAEALGVLVELSASGEWTAGQPVRIAASRIVGEAVGGQFVGRITSDNFDGDWQVVAPDLAAFAAITGRELAGAVDLTAKGAIARRGGGFSLDIDGTARDLAFGEAEIDPLFVGATTLRGAAARQADDYRFADFTLAGDRLTAVLDGAYGPGAADLSVNGRIGDVGALSDKAQGAVSFTASVTGPSADRQISASANGDGLALMERPFSEAALRLDGRLAGEDLSAGLTLSGTLGGVPLTASAVLERAGDGSRAVRSLALDAGEANAHGDIEVAADGTMVGSIRIDAPQVSVIAPLLLTDASGALTADIDLSAREGHQSATVSARAAGLHINAALIEDADIDVRAERIFTAPAVEGEITARGIVVGEIRIAELVASATRDGEETTFRASAGLERGRLETAGTIRTAEGGFDVQLTELALASELGDATLAAPASVFIRGETVAFEEIDLRIGDGRISIAGSIGEAVDIGAVIGNVPLSVANALAPALDATGLVSGVVTAKGSLDQPQGTFDLTGADIGARPLRDLGIDNLDVKAEGTFEEGSVDLVASTSIDGGTVEMRGKIGRTLELEADVSDLPLAVVNTLAPELALSGTVVGNVTATGSLGDPAVRFALKGRNVGAKQLRDAGIDGLEVDARGSFGNGRVELEEAAFSREGLSATARGTIPVDGRGLDLALVGDLPLSLTDRLLIDRGARLNGVVTADISMRGSLGDPQIAGTLSGNAITAADPGTGLAVSDISFDARLDGERIIFSRLDGALGAGTIAVTGEVAIASELGYPIDLAIVLSRARYEDGHLITATLDGELTLRGRVEGETILAGALRVERAEISVPESLPASAVLLDVEHRGAPPAVIATLRRAGIGATGGGGREGAGSMLRLDLLIVAPSRVFVRGRGLDTELGGEVRLTGPVTAIRPVGSLRMRTGRIDILGKRIAFDRGELTLVGDLDPNLDFAATSRGDTVTVSILVFGRASDPEITFTSAPELPEDEVLSQLLFGRGIDQLSPLQIAQLGIAAAQLAGGGGAGILDQLRAETGLDNLDVTSDSEGNVAVEAGRYVSENVYLGVKGGEESSGVTINLDIAGGLTARAEAGLKDSKLGVFYELEY